MNEKEVAWNTQEKKLKNQTEPKIKGELNELVTGLSLLGYRIAHASFGLITDSSSEWIRPYYPMLHIKPILDENYESQQKAILEKIRNARKLDNIDEFRTYRKELEDFEAKNPLPQYEYEMDKLIDLLAEFYMTRRTSYLAQIIAEGNPSSFSIINIGFYVAYRVVTEEILDKYRNEFIAFGKFLKEKYLSEE